MRLLLSLLFIAAVFFSNLAIAKPKVVPTAEEIYINEDQDSPPIAFQRLVFNVPETQDLGRGGFQNNIIGCTNRYQYFLESNTFDLDNRIFVNSFTEIMKEAKFNIPGDPNALFADADAAPEFLVSALISDFEIDFCHDKRDVRKGDGQLYMKLDWQVYNIAKKEIILRKETEGYHQIKKLLIIYCSLY